MSNSLLGLVFSGGKGTRLMPYTKQIPKPILLKKNNKSFLEANIEKLLELGATTVYVNYSYAQNYFKETTSKFGSKVELIHEKELIGHGRTVLNLINSINPGKNTFLYTINGDTLTDLDREKYLELVRKQEIDFSALSNNKIPIPRNLLIDKDNNLIGCKINDGEYFYKKPPQEKFYKNNLGEYILNLSSFSEILQEGLKQDFLGLFGNNDLIEIMINSKKTVKSVKMKVNSFTSINTIAEYNNFNKQENDR